MGLGWSPTIIRNHKLFDMTNIKITRMPVSDLEAENTRLLGVIASARVALTDKLYGDCGRILDTGAEGVLLAVSEVLARRHVL